VPSYAEYTKRVRRWSVITTAEFHSRIKLTKFLQKQWLNILNQCGFQRGQCITNQIFSLRMILDKSYEYNVDIHPLYTDCKQAYNNNKNTDQFTEIMKQFGIPSKLN
jgi:aerobic-type carbon monoxide dehydrogenase small subunit (CoxS/CutS family)